MRASSIRLARSCTHMRQSVSLPLDRRSYLEDVLMFALDSRKRDRQADEGCEEKNEWR